MNCQLKYREAEEKDSRWIYEVSLEKSTRNNSLNKGSFSFEDHQSWFEQKLSDPHYHILVFLGPDQQKLGVLRLEQSDRTALVSIALAPEFRGRGYGLMILSCASLYAKGNDLIELRAQIWAQNEASIHIFEKENYQFEADIQLEDGRVFKEYIRLL